VGLDLADNSLFFSPQLQRMLGYGPDEMAPRLETWTSNMHPDDSAQVMRILHDHLEGRRNRYVAEYRLRNRNGHYLWVRDSGRVSHRDAAGQPTRVVGMVHDITEQKMLQFKLEDLAANDTLTGLPNRRRGQEFLDSQIALCTRLGLTLGLCFIDLDFFKAVNDEHGHLKGDEVLHAVAQALAAATRRSDLLFRWGGEEFALVCPGAGLEEMQHVADKLRQALRAMPWQHGAQRAAPDGEHGHCAVPAARPRRPGLAAAGRLGALSCQGRSARPGRGGRRRPARALNRQFAAPPAAAADLGRKAWHTAASVSM
jgi:diguanylate cyclase (GGDEF)-like protein/PAS domain S-box-containing protein